jgi:hypothetical protein
MKWDVFSGPRRKKQDKRLDEIRALTKTIERSAPPRYRNERTARYYNYHTLPEYIQPLLELLRVLATPKRLREEERETLRAVFCRLKDFYDIRHRLSLGEALEDERLLKKMETLVLIFYDRPDLRKSALIEHLKELED